MQTHSLRRDLSSRQMRLMALGSAIGVGLFLGSATVIKLAGPSILLGYLIGGVVAYFVLSALGEMAVYKPVAGSFAAYAHEYLGPFMGYVVGWGYWIYWGVIAVIEVTAVGIYMGLWFPDTPQWIWALAAILAMGSINFISVKLFGEFEYWFALIKVATIIGMIAIGLMAIFFGYSHQGIPAGIHHLWDHGGFFPNGFSGFLLAMPLMLFAYLGVEMIGLSAGEASNPNKTIPDAIHSLSWRILIFYVGALFIILSVAPWDRVDQFGSPFVALFDQVGMRQAAGFMNFVVITAALSSCNAGIFSGGRLLYNLSIQSQAPKSLARLSSHGVPYLAILSIVVFASVGVCINYFIPKQAFDYLAYAITLIGLLIWFVILYTHVQFRKKIGNEGLRNLAYRSKLWPYSSWIAATMLSVVMVMLVLTKEAIYPLVILAILFIICISSYFLYIKKMNN